MIIFIKESIYLIWKNNEDDYFVIGELAKEKNLYVFKYYEENIYEAINGGFKPFPSMPDISAIYFSYGLFPIFLSRLPDEKRIDMPDILKRYNMEKYDEFELLKRSGATSPIDTFKFCKIRQ